MQNIRTSYQKLSLLLAFLLMLASATPSIAQCSMLMEDCDMNDKSMSDCCMPVNPAPMDCHDTDSEKSASDDNCTKCDCGFESAEKPLKVAESVISVNEVVALSDHHIRHIYHSSGLKEKAITEQTDFITPPIYLLVATFLI